MSDVVKVAVASLAVGNEGANLKLTTTDRVEINFLLDDLAVSLLGLTLGSVVAEAVARKDRGEKPRIFQREDANNG